MQSDFERPTRPMTCRLCGETHIDYTKRCSVCGGAHDGDWHKRLGDMGVFWHMAKSSPGVPREALDKIKET
jgi:hypothetical protein